MRHLNQRNPKIQRKQSEEHKDEEMKVNQRVIKTLL